MEGKRKSWSSNVADLQQQLSFLREQNAALHQSLSKLIDDGKENSRLLDRFCHLTLGLYPSEFKMQGLTFENYR